MTKNICLQHASLPKKIATIDQLTNLRLHLVIGWKNYEELVFFHVLYLNIYLSYFIVNYV